MRVRDVMRDVLAVCTEDLPLMRVFEMMERSGTDFVVVVDGQAHRKPLGLITEHQICVQVVAKRRDPRELSAANVMDARLTRLGVSDLLDNCGKVPQRSVVVDDRGGLCGWLARSDVEDRTHPTSSPYVNGSHPELAGLPS